MLNAGKAMAFIGKFAVAASFSILYTFSAELYPTCVRSSALGLGFKMYIVREDITIRKSYDHKGKRVLPIPAKIIL